MRAVTDMNDALQRLLTQLEAGTDCWISGAPAEGRRLLAEAARALAAEATVVSVVAPVGELTLSSLIAQLSGRPDFDGQDDAVLEQGFRRLTGEGRTALLLTAPQGIGRSALRYLQHVSRHAPRLAMAVLGTAPLAAALESAGLETLRARWTAPPPIEMATPLRLVASREMALVPSDAADTAEAALPVAAERAGGRRRRSLLLSASALGVVAAVASVIWVAYGAGGRVGPAISGQSMVETVPLQPATVPVAPLLAEAAPAMTADLAAPGTAAVPTVSVAAAALPPVPVAAAAVPPVSVAAAALPPLLRAGEAQRPVVTAPTETVRSGEAVAAASARPERLPTLRRTEAARPEPARTEARREPVRVARARPSWPLPPQYGEPAQYQYPPPDDRYDDRPRAWARRAMRSHDGPYLGTYAVDPYGMRVFRYDP